MCGIRLVEHRCFWAHRYWFAHRRYGQLLSLDQSPDSGLDLGLWDQTSVLRTTDIAGSSFIWLVYLKKLFNRRPLQACHGLERLWL